MFRDNFDSILNTFIWIHFLHIIETFQFYGVNEMFKLLIWRNRNGHNGRI